MARRSMDYEYLCRERRECKGQDSRGSVKLPAGQVVTLRHTHIWRQADSIDQDDNRGVLIIPLGECERRRQKGPRASLLSLHTSTSAFDYFKEYTPRPQSYTYSKYRSTPLKSQSSHSRYGLWFQNSSLIMSQCCSAILVDSCLVLWFPRTLGVATSSSDPMETPFCLRYWRIDKRSGAMNVPISGSHIRTYLQGKLHSHQSHHLRAES